MNGFQIERIQDLVYVLFRQLVIALLCLGHDEFKEFFLLLFSQILILCLSLYLLFLFLINGNFLFFHQFLFDFF